MTELTKADIRRLWVDDLRTNGHLQGQSFLCKNEKYCCLGRLCELASQHKVIAQPQTYNGIKHYGNYNAIETLPSVVKEWVGLTTPLGSYTKLDDKGCVIAECLTEKNDTGSTFAEIADIIESRPVGLFEENFDF